MTLVMFKHRLSSAGSRIRNSARPSWTILVWKFLPRLLRRRCRCSANRMMFIKSFVMNYFLWDLSCHFSSVDQLKGQVAWTAKSNVISGFTFTSMFKHASHISRKLCARINVHAPAWLRSKNTDVLSQVRWRPTSNRACFGYIEGILTHLSANKKGIVEHCRNRHNQMQRAWTV